MRRLFRWALYVFIIWVVVLVAAILLRNTMAKDLIESRVRARTGMDVRIGAVDIGLLSPTFTVENVKLYNTAELGGALFLDMPELHLEYDRGALLEGRLHVKLMRLDVTEIAAVQDKKARKSGLASAKKKSSSGGLKFTGIDTLNLSLGKFRISDLASGRAEEIQFGIKDQISHNIKSVADVPGLGFLLASQSLSSSTNSLDLAGLVQNLTSH